MHISIKKCAEGGVSQILKNFNRVIFSCDIGYRTELPKSTDMMHSGLGVVIGNDVVIGENCRIYQNVTIGARYGRDMPRIGNNVTIGANACVLGSIVVGDDVVIGAGAIVLDSVPKASVVVGVPARVVKMRD